MHRKSSWWATEGPKWIVVAVWHLVNIAVFFGTFYSYHFGPEYYYLRSIVGLGLPFARGSAQCLNVNTMLLMLPVCRNLMTMLKRLLAKKARLRSLARVLDKGLRFHITCAYFICFFTIIHVTAHIFNVENFVRAWTITSNDTRGLVSTLALLENSVVIVSSPDAIPSIEAIKLVAGLTGIVMIVILTLLLAASTVKGRYHFFNRFWYLHHLFFLYILAFVTHGAQRVIRYQSNVAVHDPTVCQSKFKLWGTSKAPDCPIPTFEKGRITSWCFMVIPCLIYIVERILRLWRGMQQVTIKEAIIHPSKVLELQLVQKGFHARPGQYIFVNCPSIAYWEWHPFTLTSAPDDNYFSIHIRCIGDWTSALYHAIAENPTQRSAWPKLCVDGPFGTATEHVRRFPVVVLFGTGIGVTPFASVLKHIWLRRNVNSSSGRHCLRKVYFYWICPDYRAFEWFDSLLRDLEQWTLEEDRPDFINFEIFLTSGWDGSKTKEIIQNEFQERDLLTGLMRKTNFGRPNFDQIIQKLAISHPDENIGVFFCGRNELSSQLHKLCNRYSGFERRNVTFYYNKENF